MIGPKRGLPIAAHLALLVALACAAAFVVVIAIVVWLPPRPPAVMRGDQVFAAFADGYREMRDSGQTPRADNLRWRVTPRAPPPQDLGESEPLRAMLAGNLHVPPEQVRINADIEQTDTFVYRVRTVEIERMQREAENLARDSERIAAEHMRAAARREQQLARAREQIERWRARRDNADAPMPPPDLPAPPEAADEPAPVAPPAPPEPPAPVDIPLFAPTPPGVALLDNFTIAAQLPDGRWLEMSQGRNWAELGWLGRAVAIIGATLALLFVASLLVARRLAQPIRQFAHAVQAVGVNPQNAPVAAQGPRELRDAADAVNAMQARLRVLIADRTQTLATVAHDMRTPLMRLRLVAENAPPEQRERMAKEIGEVEALVASFIAFARDDPAEEARVRLDLSALLQSIVDDQAETGRDVTFEGVDRVVLLGQSLGLKRLFANLIDNAVKYGARARVTLRTEEGRAIVEVADDGPGVPEDQRDGVFKPFVRLNPGPSGAGLGLAAARGIARAHGGDIVIAPSEKGALFVTTLPL